MLLAVNSLTHFLVDAVCACTLFSINGDLSTLLLVYNTLAFSTQCITGMIADRYNNYISYLGAVACVMISIGSLLNIKPIVSVILIGMGNSLFHVCGGASTLTNSEGKAADLGLFVAPGAIGLFVGTRFADLKTILSIALSIAAFVITFMPKHSNVLHSKKVESANVSIWIPVLLLFAIATRAIGGMVLTNDWMNTAVKSFVAVLFVFAGKAAGGFVCDRIGPEKTALISIPAAAVLIVFGSSSMMPSVIGQFLINLTMPVTLWLIYKSMPESPGFTFGLAASALWPGTLAGQLMTLNGRWLGISIVLSFTVGLVAVIYSARIIKRNGVCL